MPHPTSIQLADELLHEVDAWATAHGISRSAAISRLLAEALGLPTTDPLADRVAALEVRMAELEQHRTQEPVEAERYPGLPARQYLGTPCHKGHDWRGTGKSRRKIGSDSCVDCERERVQAKRAAAKA